MLQAEPLWSLSAPWLLLIGFFLFRRWRRRTADYQEMRDFKRRLSSPVSAIEKITLYLLLIAIVLVVFGIFAVHHRTQLAGATAVYASMGSALIASPVAALLANGVSWIVPSLRRANKLAMSGTGVSFASANRGLLLFAAVSVPLGLGALLIAHVQPWAR
jgi:hypothetical protein